MNPLLSFWMKAQPLTGGFCAHAWKAVSQSSALAPSSGDDATVSRAATTYSWAFDHLRTVTSRLASGVYWDVFYWATSTSSWPLVINRMHDAPILRPSSTAVCEGIKRYPTRKVDGGVVARGLTKGGRKPTALQQSQQLLQQQDFAKYQIRPNLVRRNSKEWVPEYKKERIDKINYNNVFGGLSDPSNNEIPTLAPPSSESSSYARGRSDSSGSEVSKISFLPDSPVSSSITTAESVESMSLPSQPISSKKAMFEGLSPHDVICGRGGKANTHPGNISFREEAKKLREWYESSSKSEKFTISSFLVDVVREKGGRFLRRDPDNKGVWVEADSGEVRKKASQALREGRRAGGR